MSVTDIYILKMDILALVYKIDQSAIYTILDAFDTLPDIRDRTRENVQTQGLGYWYLYIDDSKSDLSLLQSLISDDQGPSDGQSFNVILDRYLSMCYDIHNIDRWIYMPVHTAPIQVQRGFNRHDHNHTIFIAVSGYKPEDLLSMNMTKRYLFKWAIERY